MGGKTSKGFCEGKQVSSGPQMVSPVMVSRRARTVHFVGILLHLGRRGSASRRGDRSLRSRSVQNSCVSCCCKRRRFCSVS